MRKKLGFVSGLVALCFTTSAFALELDVKYSVDTYELQLSGTAYAPVSVVVTASDASELGSDSSKTIAAVNYDWRGETNIGESIALDPSLPSDTYVFRARTNEQYLSVDSSSDRLYGTIEDNKQLIEKTFYHVNASDAVMLLDEINKVSSNAASLYKTISEGVIGTYSTPCYELLELDCSDFLIYGQYVCKQMAGTKKGEKYTGLEEIKQLIEQYSVLYSAANAASASEAVGIIKDNISVFGSENIDLYVSKLNSAAQNKFFEIIKSFNADERTFSDQIPELTALATVQAADRWQTIKTVVTDTHKSVLNIDFSGDNVDGIFKKMMSYTYNTFDDIKKGFKNAEKEVEEGEDSPGKNNSGSGSSGGSSFKPAPTATQQRGETKPVILFGDVPLDFWAYEQIKTLSQSSVISGYPDGTFSPDGYVTRAEFVKMLITAFDIANEGNAVYFDDVSESDWYFKYVQTAYGCGLVNGVSETSFNPNGTITREDACTIVHRFLSSRNVLNNATADFADSAEFAVYSKDAIASLAGNGIINGVGGGKFDAKGNITRAACAVLIYNCLNI